MTHHMYHWASPMVVYYGESMKAQDAVLQGKKAIRIGQVIAIPEATGVMKYHLLT